MWSRAHNLNTVWANNRSFPPLLPLAANLVPDFLLRAGIRSMLG
jgi:hypothetical protein